MKKHAVILCLTAALLAFAFSGCSGSGGSGTLIDENESYEKADTAVDTELRDRDSIYTPLDEQAVTTLYLTVGRGSEYNGTDHTWSEVNAVPLSWYAERGLEPYRCEAAVQFGDEIGPVEGQFGYGIRVANATVELKGTSASEKLQKSYRIRLAENAGKWEKQKTIVLNKEYKDPLRYKELFAYQMLQDIPGVLSARTGLVHLYVKDKTEGSGGLFVDYGLYTQVEQVNRTYLKNHGLDEDGQCYQAKGFDFGLHPDVLKLSTAPDYDKAAFETLLQIEGAEDHEALLKMLSAVNDPGISISQVVDTYFQDDNLFNWMAAHILMGDENLKNGEWYLYHSRFTDKWYFISDDLDSILSRTEERRKDPGYSESWNYGIFRYSDNPFFARILQDEGCRQKLSRAVERLMAEYFTESHVKDVSDTYAALVQPLLFGLPDSMYARVNQKNWDFLRSQVYGEIQENAKTFETSLKAPWPFHIESLTRQNGQTVLNWEPSHLQDGTVSYTVEVCSSPLFDKPIVSEKNVTDHSLVIPQSLGFGPWFVRIQAVAPDGTTQDAREHYRLENRSIIYSTACFYVLEDGSIDKLEYVED